MWIFLLWLLLVLISPALAQSGKTPARQVLTLEDAVDTALRENRLVQNAVLDVSKSDHLLAAVRTRRFPVFEVLVLENWTLTSLGQDNQNIFGGFSSLLPIAIPISSPDINKNRQPTAYMVGFMTQPLTQQYRIGLNISMHAVMREMAQEKLRARRQRGG
ncbi:MAG: hypothetical protein HY790_03950 [Deltaproteobacteria bacterium]|nr:hypothetical protein [Deltaproteobacteria bacterium]MBI4794984.1 hypothetical protein [Deltaproteobacteria bacterium]